MASDGNFLYGKRRKISFCDGILKAGKIKKRISKKEKNLILNWFFQNFLIIKKVKK